MAENILTMENIVKTYKMGDEQQTVLKGIDLQVDKGCLLYTSPSPRD